MNIYSRKQSRTKIYFGFYVSNMCNSYTVEFLIYVYTPNSNNRIFWGSSRQATDSGQQYSHDSKPVKQEVAILPEHLCTSAVIAGFGSRNLQFSVYCFVENYCIFVPFILAIVCPSVCVFWLPLWHFHTFHIKDWRSVYFFMPSTRRETHNY